MLRSGLRPLLVLVLFEGALFTGGFQFLSGLLATRFGSGPFVIGLTLAALGVAQLGVAKALPHVLRRATEERLVAVGGTMMACAYVIAAVAPAVGWVAASAALLGAGFSLCHSTLQARATEAFPAARGRALALFAFSLFVGGAAGTFAMGLLTEWLDYGSSFVVVGLCLVPFAHFAMRTVAAEGRRARLLALSTERDEASLPGAATLQSR